MSVHVCLSAVPSSIWEARGVDPGAPGGTWARLPGDALGGDFSAPGGSWARLGQAGGGGRGEGGSESATKLSKMGT